jgi:MraZ protein
MARVITADKDFIAAAAMPVATPDVPVMTGTHFHSLDEKGRVIIPAKLRPALTEKFWMMLDENDNIGLYNYKTGMTAMEHCEQLISANPDDLQLADAVERITGHAEVMEVEGGFRVQIPEFLRYHAGLDKEVVTVGVLNHAVLWSRERWEARQREQRLAGVEVRRAQGGIMRAAASAITQAQEAEDGKEQRPSQEIAAIDAGAVGGGGRAGRSSGRGPEPGSGREDGEDTSAGHGRRGARLLKMS